MRDINTVVMRYIHTVVMRYIHTVVMRINLNMGSTWFFRFHLLAQFCEMLCIFFLTQLILN